MKPGIGEIAYALHVRECWHAAHSRMGEQAVVEGEWRKIGTVYCEREWHMRPFERGVASSAGLPGRGVNSTTRLEQHRARRLPPPRLRPIPSPAHCERGRSKVHHLGRFLTMFWWQRSPTFLSLWPLLFHIAVHAQNISTSGPVPPLQWINITGLTTGSAPPALRDASIGYYDDTRTLLIFGGESAQGIPQSQTFLCAIAPLLHALRIDFAQTLVSILTRSHGLRTPLPTV